MKTHATDILYISNFQLGMEVAASLSLTPWFPYGDDAHIEKAPNIKYFIPSM